MRFIWFLAAATAIRLLVAAMTPLSADEVYYWVWSQALAPGYLDHPPMVALWIWAGTHLAGDTVLGIRLLGPLAAALGSLLLISAGRDLAPNTQAGTKAGTRAAWLLNGTLVLNAGAVLMTPDTPLLLFWTASLAALARLVRTGNGVWFLAAGAAAGLALDSKYTAALLAPCTLAWLLLAPPMRPWLRCWQPYAAAVLALALFAPVLAWNAAHGWASFAKQGGRGGDWHPSMALGNVAELVGGQLGLATPLLFGLFCIAIWRLMRAAGWRQPGAGLALALTVLPAAVFVEHALGGRVQANWPGVLYPGAALAAALVLPVLWRGTASLATAVGLVLSGLVFLQATAAPLSLPRHLDFSLIRLAAWDTLAVQAELRATETHASFLAADEYGLAAELAFHLATPVIAVEPRWLLFNLPRASIGGQSGILLRSARRAVPPDTRLWPAATLIGTLSRSRDGVVAESYNVFRVTAAADLPAVILPHGAAPPN
jgi:4-amino-4-deoxy-L-arabinose transferase-like glycosyltransferase